MGHHSMVNVLFHASGRPLWLTDWPQNNSKILGALSTYRESEGLYTRTTEKFGALGDRREFVMMILFLDTLNP